MALCGFPHLRACFLRCLRSIHLCIEETHGYRRCSVGSAETPVGAEHVGGACCAAMRLGLQIVEGFEIETQGRDGSHSIGRVLPSTAAGCWPGSRCCPTVVVPLVMPRCEWSRDEPGQNGLPGQFHNGGVVRQLLGIDFGFDGGDLRARDENVSVLEGLPPVTVDHAHVAQHDRWRMGSVGPGGKGEEVRR